MRTECRNEGLGRPHGERNTAHVASEGTNERSGTQRAARADRGHPRDRAAARAGPQLARTPGGVARRPRRGQRRAGVLAALSGVRHLRGLPRRRGPRRRGRSLAEATTHRADGAGMSTHFNYCEPPDVPEGMTLAEYRRDRARKRKPTWR